MSDYERLFVWLGIACIAGVIDAGVFWLGVRYLGWSLCWLPLAFTVAFVTVVYAGSLCCASAARGEE